MVVVCRLNQVVSVLNVGAVHLDFSRHFGRVKSTVEIQKKCKVSAQGSKIQVSSFPRRPKNG